MIKRKNGRRPLWYTGAVICAMALTLVFSGVESQAKEGKAKIDGVNVRGEATTDAIKVGMLPIGTPFSVTEESADSSGKTWYHIIYSAEGEQKTGWIRSDMAEITADDQPAEQPEEQPEEQVPETTEIDGVTIQEPETIPDYGNGFTSTQLDTASGSYTVLSVAADAAEGSEFYLVYGTDNNGETGWYSYDASGETMQRYVGQFAGEDKETEAMLQSLRTENLQLKEQNDSALSLRTYLAIGFGILSLLLLVIVVLLIIRLRHAGGMDDDYMDDYDDDDYDDEDEDDDDDDDYKVTYTEEESVVVSSDTHDPSWMAVARAKKEEKRKEEQKRREAEAEAEDEKESQSSIDFSEMDGDEVLADLVKDDIQEDIEEDVQEEVEKEERRKEKKKKPIVISEDDYDDSDDFDVEIIDLDDL